ncbi:hypothetical protein RB653_000573 [Dictyostelium firmibasis]|uniref:Uncharacterized protein n=1 Tax=Dictyostelium firmibasis TaxID=79012 RepID=A0AAN7U2X7_9MYCE
MILIINLIVADNTKFIITILGGCDQSFTTELDRCTEINVCGYEYVQVKTQFIGQYIANLYNKNMFRCNENMPDDMILFDCGSGSSFPGSYSIKCIKPGGETTSTSTTSIPFSTTIVSSSSTTTTTTISTTNGNTISGDSGTKSSTTAHLFSTATSSTSSSSTSPSTTISTTNGNTISGDSGSGGIASGTKSSTTAHLFSTATSSTSSSSTTAAASTTTAASTTAASTSASTSTTGGVTGATCQTLNSSATVSYIATTPYIQCNGSPDLKCNGLCTSLLPNYTKTCYANKYIDCSGISIKCSIGGVEVCEVNWQYTSSTTTSTSESKSESNYSVSKFCNISSLYYLTFIILLTIFYQ